MEIPLWNPGHIPLTKVNSVATSLGLDEVEKIKE